MIKKIAYFLAGAVIAIAVIWRAYRNVDAQSREIRSLQEEVARVKEERDAAISKASSAAAEVSRLQTSLANAAPPKDAPFEDALAEWLGKVHKLSSYLDKHPERRIPQMDLLKSGDWLDVTKDTKLETEADFREALGRLRGIARQKVAGELGKALKQAVADGGGAIPETPQGLAAYLPADFNPAILEQMAMNPSGNVPGIRLWGAGGKPGKWLLVDTPVDLWDATAFYGSDGGMGIRAAFATGADSVKTAIAQYTQATGATPSSSSQLAQYPGIKDINQSTLDDLFAALTTKAAP